MTAFLAVTIDDNGYLKVAPFTAANLAAAETGVKNAIGAQLATGLPVNPATGQPDVRTAVAQAAQNAISPPAGGVLVGIIQIDAATTVLPGATTATPLSNNWTT